MRRGEGGSPMPGGVPFLRQGDYPVVETEGNPYAEGVKELYARLLKYALKKRTDGQALVAVGHLLATGSEIAEKDHSKRIIIGGRKSVSPSLFPEQIVYTALGHIHKAQRVSGRGEYPLCRQSLTYVVCREALSPRSGKSDSG